MLEGLMWTEKYRPRSLEQMALTPETLSLLQGYVDQEEVPHLLFFGPAGCGKTTVARILTDNLDCKVLPLNASSERGIDTIRDKIGTFVRGRMGTTWNVVFLDEADALTRDAQTALRNMMEQHADRSRFILTANYPHRIIDPIQSRCVVVGMQETPVKERFRVLSRVLQEEGIQADPKVAMTWAHRYKDLRKMLMGAQKSVMSEGELVPAQDTEASPADIFQAVDKDRWSFLKEVVKHTGFDHRQALIDLFHAVPDDYGRAATFRAIIGKWVSRPMRDPVVHFLAACSELIAERPVG